ncbi:MAG: AMP-binding protein [Myxococcota bacterium]|nr:AMP-binding protein [Myxococcota bacterium]
MNPRLLHDELAIAAKAWPDQVAFVTPKKEISFGELKKKQSALAGALQGLGLERGARLAILGHNSADYIAWHYAAAEAGLIFHVLNTRLAKGELQWMIDNAESAALIADPDFSSLAQELMAACASLGFLVGMEGEEGLDHETEALVARGHESRPPGVDPEDAALMIYTSGTTGRPKGALQSHAGSVVADGLTRDAVDITREDTYLALMPFFHQAGLIRTRATLLAGGRTVIAGKVEAAATAKAIVDYGVTFTMLAAPQQNAAIREKIEQDGVEGFRNLRMILGGGGVGQRATRTIQRTCEALDCEYFGVYGQTETTGPAVYITGQDVFDRPASCGRPLPGVKVEIWNDDGSRQSADHVGEIMVSGPITASYWRNEEANQALYSGDWIHTGDLGYLDRDGFLYIKGRVKELIKTGAENVYPREVEVVLEEHPSVSDVAIFGLPDDRWGEIVVAALVCRGGEPPSLQELKAFCRGKIGAYKIPKALLFVEEIPRNHTGKILRGALSRQALERRGEKAPAA